MLAPMEVLMVLLAVALAMFLYGYFKSRERATAIVKRFCSRHEIQLLDGAVALDSMRWQWFNHRLVQIFSWRFEYTNGVGDDTRFDDNVDAYDLARSNQRRAGLLVMRGGEDHTLILSEDPQFEATR
jgi:hypothetical protein